MLYTHVDFFLNFGSDINECSEGVVDIGGLAASLFWCDQKCVNTPGWYKCDCNSGYYLGSDNKTCIGSWSNNNYDVLYNYSNRRLEG